MALAGRAQPRNLPKPLPVKAPQRKVLNIKSGNVTFTVEVEGNADESASR